MKAFLAIILPALALIFSASQAQATVDAHDRVYIVVEDINGIDAPTYLVERAPIVGCYGLRQGPRLSAWVTEYKAPQNIGCGGTTSFENINALTCATVVDSKESDDYSSFTEITLDVSKCQEKNNPNFLKAIETSARKNFPQANKSQAVILQLIK